MNIQIFGKTKSFDSKKAERWFRERGIKYQYIDLNQKGMSRGELTSVLQSVGSIDRLIDNNSKSQDAVLIRYLSGDSAKLEKLIENSSLLISPIVRNGKAATVGYCPEIWDLWLKDE